VWFLLISRHLLSILQAVYDTTHSMSSELSPDLIRELKALIGCAPLIQFNLQHPVSSIALASDASSSGGAVVWLPCSEQRSIEVLFAQQQAGWYTRLIPSQTNECTMSQQALNLASDPNWSLGVSTRWKFSDHINILEGRSIILGLTWLLQFTQSKVSKTRIPFLLDSSVMVGCLSKGRSSSNRLNNICRRIAALVVLNQACFGWVWVATDVMPADKPSRQ
jgi:hypothetical protein